MFVEFLNYFVMPAKIDHDRPSVRGLADLLRHPEQWPLGFEYYYLAMPNCAVGLAAQRWQGKADLEWIARALGMSYDMAHTMFIYRSKLPGRAGYGPLSIAKSLEQYARHRDWFEKKWGGESFR